MRWVEATVATSRAPPSVAGVGRAQDGDMAIRACVHLFLLDAQTGRTRAQLPPGDNSFSTNSEWVLSWPAKGRLVRAWSILENRLRWERRVPSDGCNASAESRQVVVICPGHVEMRRWSDGQRLWGTTGTARGHSDELVLVERDGRLRVLDAETGNELVGRPTLFEQVCLLGDSLYGITHEKLVRLDARTGAAVAEVTLSGPDARVFCADSVRADQPPEFAGEPRLPMMQEPGAPLVTTLPGAIAAYDPETLSQLWRYPLIDGYHPAVLHAGSVARRRGTELLSLVPGPRRPHRGHAVGHRRAPGAGASCLRRTLGLDQGRPLFSLRVGRAHRAGALETRPRAGLVSTVRRTVPDGSARAVGTRYFPDHRDEHARRSVQKLAATPYATFRW